MTTAKKSSKNIRGMSKTYQEIKRMQEAENKPFRKIYKELNVPEDCPGINWRKRKDGYYADISFDREILPLLKELNGLPYCHTTGSCAGHSQGELRKNWNLGWGVDTPYRITLTIHLKTDDDSIKKFISVAQAFAKVSNGKFWCELGYSQLDDFQDSNKVTEKGYMPLEIQVFALTKRRRNKLIEKYTNILKNKQY